MQDRLRRRITIKADAIMCYFIFINKVPYNIIHLSSVFKQEQVPQSCQRPSRNEVKREKWKSFAKIRSSRYGIWMIRMKLSSVGWRGHSVSLGTVYFFGSQSRRLSVISRAWTSPAPFCRLYWKVPVCLPWEWWWVRALLSEYQHKAPPSPLLSLTELCL